MHTTVCVGKVGDNCGASCASAKKGCGVAFPSQVTIRSAAWSALASVLARAGHGIWFNDHIEDDGSTVFKHACKLGLEGIVSKRKDSPYRSGRSPDWLKMKNPNAPAMKREDEEDWGKGRWR